MFQVHNSCATTTVPYYYVSFCVSNVEQLIVWYISDEQSYCNLIKNRHKFQGTVIERCAARGRPEIFREIFLEVAM